MDLTKINETPSIVIDGDKLTHNIKTMAGHCRHHNIDLRPHFKSHKCPAIAKMQIAAGAVGMCCARLGEADILLQAGIKNVLLTSPIVSDNALERFIYLTKQYDDAHLSMVVDNTTIVEKLHKLCRKASVKVNIHIDLDVGTRRTGVRIDQRADAVLHSILTCEYLRLDGIQAYAGHLMHLSDHNLRNEAATAVHLQLNSLIERWRQQVDLQSLCVSGGGTGTWDLDTSTTSPYTELQAGSYALWDADYRAALGYKDIPFQDALFIVATVISHPSSRMATIDAGLKSMATDSGKAQVLDAHGISTAEYLFTGDEHGGLLYQENTDLPPLGTKILLFNPHCDPTMNLYDQCTLLYANGQIENLDITARGARFYD